MREAVTSRLRPKTVTGATAWATVSATRLATDRGAWASGRGPPKSRKPMRLRHTPPPQSWPSRSSPR